MFDISWQELALIALVAVLVIPPKDLPRALATAGRWMRRAKGMMRDVQNGIDELAREAEFVRTAPTGARGGGEDVPAPDHRSYRGRNPARHEADRATPGPDS